MSRRSLVVRSIAEAERVGKKGASVKDTGSALPELMDKVRSIVGKSTTADLTAKDVYNAVAYTTRDGLIERFNKTHEHWAVSETHTKCELNI
jgi:hypothetical protein